MSTRPPDVAVETDPAQPLRRVSIRRATTSLALLLAIAAGLVVRIGFPDHHQDRGSILPWVAAVGVGVLAVLVGRSSLRAVRRTTETTPRINDGIVEGCTWAAVVGVYYAWSSLFALGLAMRGIEYLSGDVVHAVGPALVACIAVGAGYGLAAAIWLMRWERRTGLRLLCGTKLRYRPLTRRDARRFVGMDDILVVRARSDADAGSQHLPGEPIT